MMNIAQEISQIQSWIDNINFNISEMPDSHMINGMMKQKKLYKNRIAELKQKEENGKSKRS